MPLGTLARIEDKTGPLTITRYNMYASASINGASKPDVSTGTVIEHVTRLAKEAGTPFEWTQLYFLQVEAGNVAFLVFALGTVLVYLVLAAKYESWKLPLAVILVVPLCMLAAVTGMTLAGLPVDIFVQIGLLVLVGLASKNAILIVEYARDLRIRAKSCTPSRRGRRQNPLPTDHHDVAGVHLRRAAAGRRRRRGAEMRRSLGTAVFTGMIGVTLFGIFLTPVFYFILMWLGSKPNKTGIK